MLYICCRGTIRIPLVLHKWKCGGHKRFDRDFVFACFGERNYIRCHPFISLSDTPFLLSFTIFKRGVFANCLGFLHGLEPIPPALKRLEHRPLLMWGSKYMRS